MYPYGIFDVGNFSKHHYNFVMTNKDGKIISNKVFSSRNAAMNEMYSKMAGRSLSLKKVWDDKHDKTYITNEGIQFHINRDC